MPIIVSSKDQRRSEKPDEDIASRAIAAYAVN